MKVWRYWQYFASIVRKDGDVVVVEKGGREERKVWNLMW
jgi:hypothetical protein